MPLLALLACIDPSPLATVPGATRLAELANGELLVGTSAGTLWLVDSFGDTRELATLPAPVVELVTDPVGKYWARGADGRVFEGALWSDPVHVGDHAQLLVRDCTETRWIDAEADAGVSSLALGASCDTLVEGTFGGAVLGTRVSAAPISRVQSRGSGALWVDATGAAGCLNCSLAVPDFGVIDAISIHLAPLVPGELVWLDGEGRLWATSD